MLFTAQNPINNTQNNTQKNSPYLKGYYKFLKYIENANIIDSFEQIKSYHGTIFIPLSIITKLIKDGEIKMIEFLSYRGYPLLAIHHTTVNWLVTSKKVELLSFVLFRGYPVMSACTENSFTAAVEDNDVPTVTLLVKYGMLDNKFLANKCFQHLVLVNNVPLATMFLENGVSTHACSKDLFYSIVDKSQTEIIELLIKCGFLENNTLTDFYRTIGKILIDNPMLSVFLIECEMKIANNCVAKMKPFDTKKVFAVINIIFNTENISALNHVIEKFSIRVLDNLLPETVKRLIISLRYPCVQILLEHDIDLRKYFTQDDFDTLCNYESKFDTTIGLLLDTGLYYPNKLNIHTFQNLLDNNNLTRFRLLIDKGLNVLSFPAIEFENAVINNIGVSVTNELLLMGYHVLSSDIFRFNRWRAIENINILMALVPAVRKKMLCVDKNGNNCFVSTPQITKSAIGIILSFIGTLSIKNLQGELEFFPNTFFEILVFTQNLHCKPRGFVCKLLEEEFLSNNKNIDDCYFVI
jgi:hypothetical protein